MFDKSIIMKTNYTASEDMDFKYVIQDTGAYLIGAKYSYEELMEHEQIPFKFKAIVEHYILKDTELSTSLESQMYYMTSKDFSYKTYEQLKAKIKVSQLVEKKSLFGKSKMVYEEKIMSLREFCEINLAKKKATGILVREVIISKLALMSFSV